MAATRVLIVDDERDFRETLAKVLSRRGYEVTSVADGAEAVRAASGGGVDVALVDLKMPDLDGLQTMSRIKAAAPAQRVIILTGHLLKSSEEEGLALGAFAYLTKPIAVAELVRVIETAAGSRARRSDPAPPFH